MSGLAGQERAPSPAIEALFERSFVVDGALTYTRKRDPDCRADCETEYVPLAEITPLMGVHVGTVTISRELERVRRNATWVRGQPGGLLVETFNDLDVARRTGRFGVILYTQQVPLLDGDPGGVDAWRDAGLRIVQLAYSSRVPLPHFRARNKLAGGADEPDQGLTELGRAVVDRLVANHILIDVSHCSEKTTMEVLARVDVPILANHANAKALTVTMRDGVPLGRNKSDDELRAIAATGGVIGINTVGWMLDRDGDRQATLEDFLAHVDHCVRLVGIDHVGLSSDAIVDGWAPDDIHYADAALADPRRWFTVAERLREDMGYTDEMLEKLLGGNFLRVYRAVLPGVTAPDGLVAEVDGGRVRLRWQPSTARGLPEPTYAVELAGETEGGEDFLLVRSGLSECGVTLEGLPAATAFRFRVIGRAGRHTARSGEHPFVTR